MLINYVCLHSFISYHRPPDANLTILCRAMEFVAQGHVLLLPVILRLPLVIWAMVVM